LKIAVLGAGVVGVAAAWYLAADGHDVIVLDRAEGPALETSFANGGQVSVSQTEPWANPAAPGQVLRWFGREDAPLLFRLRADPALLAWGMRFLLECLPGRTRRNTLDALALGLYSREALRALRAELALDYDQQTRGILQLYEVGAALAEASRRARVLTAHGCRVDVLTPEQCFAVEPALVQAQVKIAGGTYAPDDESGDACKFTAALARHCGESGVEFRFGSEILALRCEENVLRSVVVKEKSGRADELGVDACVVSLGSHSTLLLRRAGISIPVYPVKGYSVTIPIDDPAAAPTASITDEAHKIVISRLGDRLRAAGTAEMAGYDTSLNQVRCEAIRNRARAWFPGASRYDRVDYWTGLRPATPGNVPLIGRTRIANVFVNTGHGTLGWTLACGSGKALAEIAAGRRPALDFPFLQPARAPERYHQTPPTPRP
jgi:D-amino-acid dehydrogenase